MKCKSLATRMAGCLAFAAWAAGCGVGEAVDAGAPSLTRVAVVRLVESDSLYVGKPRFLWVDSADGSFLVADAFWDRVIRFNRSGRIEMKYGRRGDGPGELRQLGTAFRSGGEVVAVDVNKHKMVRYNRSTGSVAGEVPFLGFIHSVAGDSNVLWLGLQNRGYGTSVAVWRKGSNELEYLGRLPLEYLESEPLSAVYNAVNIATWADTILVGVMGLNEVTVMDTTGRHIKSLWPPAVRRRGALPDVVERFDAMTFPDIFGASSALFQMHRLPNGQTALVHYDQNRLPNERPGWRGRLFLTLLDRKLASACADAEIEVSQHAQPYVAFLADTMFVLQQTINGVSADLRVTSYLVDDDKCIWLPADRANADAEG